MKKSLFLLLLFVFMLFGCLNTEDGTEKPADPQEAETAGKVTEPQIIADQLDIPWSITKSQDTFYISERTGSIVQIKNGEKTVQPVQLAKPLATASEAGLLGFVLAPDFEETGRAFAYYTYEDESGQFNRIIELVLTDDQWSEQKVLLDQIPSGQYHHGGRLKIGPDGKLYATAGDAATEPEIAQDPESLGGKILRLNLDGSVPSDNPFSGSYVYSYGHRNPQGLAWNETGTLYASEHGPSAHDEINRIEAGLNYGWPEIVGDETGPEMETPLFQSGNDTWAPSGIAFHNGKLYVATLRGNAVRQFDLEQKTTSEFISGLGRIRDVLIEGNTLYFVSNNTDGRGNPAENDDKLYRVELEIETGQGQKS
ncbi:PQQ-dependent sugar dehydrogenase [Bacillus sp. V33-4]|uniref:PQQ-dependent sugar dehydrogenase n=1 Tax=Bacillus sp. V33-4 TaxID=2054169 RepID=UPI000C763488|nr:PQQ-dependent sugar dehydrogenase [Bacillus sp. V33-4]PLR84724.1 quinoprotein glucose dehydrogenase [Bacillus sp. V33-4]